MKYDISLKDLVAWVQELEKSLNKSRVQLERMNAKVDAADKNIDDAVASGSESKIDLAYDRYALLLDESKEKEKMIHQLEVRINFLNQVIENYTASK